MPGSRPSGLSASPKSLSAPAFQEMLRQCIHCGMCIQTCPTYLVLGTEMDNPRGRIVLMSAASEGRIGLRGVFADHIGLCIACRACEIACPSGVQYGALVEIARLSIENSRKPSLLEHATRRFVLHELMPYLARIKLIAYLARLYQVSGLQHLFRALDILPGRLKLLDGLLPPLPKHYQDYRQVAPAMGSRRGRVAFFYGCVQEGFLAEVNQATIRVLQRNGYEVHFPPGQTCCGAAQIHLGEEELSRQLARQNIDAFLDLESGGSPIDAIIDNAGGCGATLKEYARLLYGDRNYADKARLFSSKVKDITEFLVEHFNHPPTGEIRARVTYSDSCHLRQVQKVIQAPRDLLKAIPGLELIELRSPDQCCGSGGVYNIIHPVTANAILDRKMSDIALTGADLIAVSNTGCYFQLLYGVRRAHSTARVVHLVELLDQSYANS